jgi:hypothetical protein
VGFHLSLSVDRFEGQDKPIAVLLTDDGTAIHWPGSLLPSGVKPGDVLTFAIEHDVEATRTLADETRQVHRRLSKVDPGGDIQL